MDAQTTIQLTLVVKGDARAALEALNRRLFGPLSSWFVEDVGVKPPYPEGSLLWYWIPDYGECLGMNSPKSPEAPRL